jgi:hypothetical protein
MEELWVVGTLAESGANRDEHLLAVEVEVFGRRARVVEADVLRSHNASDRNAMVRCAVIVRDGKRLLAFDALDEQLAVAESEVPEGGPKPCVLPFARRRNWPAWMR